MLKEEFLNWNANLFILLNIQFVGTDGCRVQPGEFYIRFSDLKLVSLSQHCLFIAQLCEHAVPILVHCITLPVGADTFWKQIEEDFQSTDWRHRFTAGIVAGSLIKQLHIYNIILYYDTTFAMHSRTCGHHYQIYRFVPSKEQPSFADSNG